MKFICEPSDANFIQSAPLQFINTVDIDASAEDVFVSLADPDAWLKWFPDMTFAAWEGEPGAGTNRIVKVGLIELTEHFVEWHENKSMAFYIRETSLPFARTMVENYTIEELGDGVRFTYAVGLELRKPFSLIKFFAKPIFGKMFKDAANGFQKYMNSKH